MVDNADDVLDKYKEAGRIAASVREHSRQLVKPGARLIDIAEMIEKRIMDSGAEPAFPVNISLNDAAAHDTAGKGDSRTITDNDIVKIDIGVHVDGYVGDTAYTAAWRPDLIRLIKTAEKALEAAIGLCTPGQNLGIISEAIENTIRSEGLLPISNLAGHGLERYDLHAEPQVHNIFVKTNYVLRQNQVIAIEPFVTTASGAGRVKDSYDKKIFLLIAQKPVRTPAARVIIKDVQKYNDLPFALRWLNQEGFGFQMGMKELVDRGVLYEYPVLRETTGQPIAQAEHTIIVSEQPIVTTR